jgi:hypothetical protein
MTATALVTALPRATAELHTTVTTTITVEGDTMTEGVTKTNTGDRDAMTMNLETIVAVNAVVLLLEGEGATLAVRLAGVPHRPPETTTINPLRIPGFCHISSFTAVQYALVSLNPLTRFVETRRCSPQLFTTLV